MALRKSRTKTATEEVRNDGKSPETDITNENQENIEMSTATEPQFAEPDFENVDVDVDAPAKASEDTVAAPVEGEKPAKDKKESTRPPVPEGKVSPVQFAKILSEHLRQEHPELGVRLPEGQSVAPQVVYSYIKNNGPESKNPFPATKAEGRTAVVEPQAGLEWWDAKDLRVKAQKAGAAEKAAKKAAKGSESKSGDAPTEVAEQAPIVEAE